MGTNTMFLVSKSYALFGPCQPDRATTKGVYKVYIKQPIKLSLCLRNKFDQLNSQFRLAYSACYW